MGTKTAKPRGYMIKRGGEKGASVRFLLEFRARWLQKKVNILVTANVI